MSMGVSISIDPADPTPPYEQLRRQLATLIASGTLEPGDRLAPVRQLAADLALAPGTVARTYRELEAAGLVETRRGGGTRVQAPTTRMTAADRKNRLVALAEEFVAQARLVGAEDAQIQQIVADAL
jgi:DNA-binding transcriptional regulator YhcF (GntR family)